MKYLLIISLMLAGCAGYTPTVDTPSPAMIIDRQAASSSITLQWTAPGDDGHTGTASEYDVRYSTSPITKENWDKAIQVDGEPKPQLAGKMESMTITKLADTTYYFALKTADEVPNWSTMSNVAIYSAGADKSTGGRRVLIRL